MPSNQVTIHLPNQNHYRFADVAEMFSAQMPYAKFILPTAPTQAVTMNGGMAMSSWYDIVGLDDRAAESCDGLNDSRYVGLISELWSCTYSLTSIFYLIYMIYYILYIYMTYLMIYHIGILIA
jgi:hypothetical protein